MNGSSAQLYNNLLPTIEIDASIPCLPEHLRDVVLFGYMTDWRKGEIAGLQWANVNRADAIIRLVPEQNKGRTGRVLALQGELVALGERRWRARKIGRRLAQHVFHPDGNPLGGFREAWLTACRM